MFSFSITAWVTLCPESPAAGGGGRKHLPPEHTVVTGAPNNELVNQKKITI